MDLRRGDFFDVLLNRRRRLRKPKDDGVEHGLGALAQGDIIQLADGIRGLGDDHIGASLVAAMRRAKLVKVLVVIMTVGMPRCFECGSDVATPRRARASITCGSDHHVHAPGQIIEGAAQGIDKPTGALRQFSSRLLHDHRLQTIFLRQ